MVSKSAINGSWQNRLGGTKHSIFMAEEITPSVVSWRYVYISGPFGSMCKASTWHNAVYIWYNSLCAYILQRQLNVTIFLD